MKEIGIFTIASPLHDKTAVENMTREFLDCLNLDIDFLGSDFSEYGRRAVSIIFVCTGGTEGVFVNLLPQLRAASNAPVYLMASPKNNSLPASMEILSYLRQEGLRGEIFHGEPQEISRRIWLLARVEATRRRLQGTRLGVIGQPSDWLISSKADYDAARKRLGIELMDIPMQELLDGIAAAPDVTPQLNAEAEDVRQSLPGAWKIYLALKKIVESHNLQGFTLRCFDLLTAVKNTGCLALAKLNAEGITAGCEGDIPTLLSMTIARALTGEANFQANPAYSKDDGHILFAHCTIPLSIVKRFELDTHFESGIGVGIRGYAEPGDMTVFKISGDLSRFFIDSVRLEECQAAAALCRTQMLVCSKTGEWQKYFKTRPIGNHHVIIPGDHAEALRELMEGRLGIKPWRG